MKSYLSGLKCTLCGCEYSADLPMRLCKECGKILFPKYDISRMQRECSRNIWEDRPNNLWRFFEILPIQDQGSIVTLGEGGTPLLDAPSLAADLGLRRLYIKDESFNPTGTFKARGMATAVSKAKELGQERLTVPSAGNAASALAAYAARAGIEAHVIMPSDVPEANKNECEKLGAHVSLVQGHIGDAAKVAQAKANELGLFDVSTLKEPYRVEGKKTMGLEIARDLGWKLPDVVVYPTGGGTGIIGIHKAFEELLDLGWVNGAQPRFVAVQAEGCKPIVKAFNDGVNEAQSYKNPHTIASGLRVPHPFGDYLILKILKDTDGCAIAVTDKEMIAGVNEVASSEGLFVCPEGAATFAALKILLKQGQIDKDEEVILLNTGTGLKYMDVLP
jgi:threonine synthase